MTIFCQNLKKFRIAKHLTQEQVAQTLGLSAQTISRWECNTTLPDITILPQLAKLYGVTIDDFYRQGSTVYENYAMRLLSVFESSHDPEDFIQAYTEYQKLFKSGNYSRNDLRSYGILLQYMMQICREKAEESFDRVLKEGPGDDPETYWSTYRQKGYFLWDLRRNQEMIDTFLPLVEAGSNELQEWICLIQAYSLDKHYEKGWIYLQKAMEKFPESALIHTHAGDVLRSMKRYEEAFVHWKRALEMEPQWFDSAYSMGFCYEEIGEYEKAAEVFSQIADTLESRGYEGEVALPRMLADQCWKKLAKG